VTTQFAEPQSQASLSRFAVYGAFLGDDRRAVHYLRGIGYRGELSGARVSRVLAKYWKGAMAVSSGTMAMAPDFAYDTRTVLDVVQEIQESERGLLYASRSGTVVWEDRSARYANQTALWTFGENPPGADPVELPYADFKTDHDPTYVFSQANLTRPDNNDFPPIVNADTEAKYGQRIVTQTVQCTTDFDLTQAGIFYTSRYSTPKTRVTTLTLMPSSNPALWPAVLSLEISQRVRVVRRSAFTRGEEFYVEKISHRVDADAGTWQYDLQLSPVFVPKAWVLGDSTLGVLGSTTTPIY
jgi:hypothetical protein